MGLETLKIALVFAALNTLDRNILCTLLYRDNVGRRRETNDRETLSPTELQ
jgi:hypothetical protein